MAAPTSPAPTKIRIGKKLGKAFERVQERIRERAYHRFLARGSEHGDPVSDWLDAQLEVVTPVGLTLKEQKKNIVVEGDCKGFAPREIEIEISGDTLKVFGSHSQSRTNKVDGVLESSEESAYFYQALQLPAAVDVDGSQANLQKNGKLKITLPKKA